MTEQGVVLSAKEKFATVRIERNSACASCGKCGMTEKQKHVDIYATNEVGAKTGDTVTLDIPEANSAKLALVGYFIPLAPALILLFVSLALKWNEWLAFGLFFAGLAVGFVAVALIDRFHKHKWAETPVIKEIIHSNAAVTQNTQQGDSNDE